jgi:hypothetical protein
MKTVRKDVNKTPGKGIEDKKKHQDRKKVENQKQNTSEFKQHPKTIGHHGTDDEKTLNPEE